MLELDSLAVHDASLSIGILGLAFFSAMIHLDGSNGLDFASHDVERLPIRRVLHKSGTLKELVIHLNELQDSSNESALLRVKHVAVDLTRDIVGTRPGTVPGLRIVAKLAHETPLKLSLSTILPSEKLFVFPVSACWIQSPHDPCTNCLKLLNNDFDAYKSHTSFPCLRDLTYGFTLDGGLQDYIRVPRPHLSLIKIPPLVSVHDCCFLLDIALPFYSFCKDNLLRMLQQDPQARVLVILNDSAREANDCLLVINHLDLEHLFVTFVDMDKLRKNPSLVSGVYANEFHHVLVFAPGSDAVEAALAVSVHTKLASTKLRYSIALFGANADLKLDASKIPEDKTVYRVKLSYKDKFLMEELIDTLAGFNASTSTKKPLRSMSMGTLSSSDSIPSSELISTSENEEVTKKKLRFKKETEVVAPPKLSRTHISWLYCDDDYKLCTGEDGGCLPSRCQSTSDINRLLRRKVQTRRVFYTHRPSCHVKKNVFIFASDQ